MDIYKIIFVLCTLPQSAFVPCMKLFKNLLPEFIVLSFGICWRSDKTKEKTEGKIF